MVCAEKTELSTVSINMMGINVKFILIFPKKK